jgi:transcriptional regulator with XRE-family HTH domain
VNNTRDENVIRKFGAHLRAIRVAKDMTLESLAFEAEIEVSQVYRIERGKVNPTLSTLNILANALNISLMELMNFQ